MGAGGGGGGFGNTMGGRTQLSTGTKASAIKLTSSLPENTQKPVKDFFKGGSNKYNNFNVEKLDNGNTLAKMEKPGNVPGSKAIYYKEINPEGKTIKVYKETYAPDGSLIHTKEK